MARLFSSVIRKTLFAKKKNLVSLDQPFTVITKLLRDHRITDIIDAGAGDGRISKRLLRSFPDAQVYAFEPNPFYREILKRYAAEDYRFHPQFMALSDREGIEGLHVTKSAGNTSLFKPGERLKKMYPQVQDDVLDGTLEPYLLSHLFSDL